MMYRSGKRRIFAALGISVLLSGFGAPAGAAVLFSDDFETPSSTSTNWSNDRGDWAAGSGVYNAASPSNSPVTYTDVTSLPTLTNFRVEVDVNSLDDGGVWLRSDFNGGNINGILLVTGGFSHAGSGLYWHVVTNGSFSGILSPGGSGLADTSPTIRVDVMGDTYSAYADNILITTLTDTTFTSGGVGLYDFSTIQTFDNFVVSDFTHPDVFGVPEPLTLTLFGAGLAGLGLVRQRKG